MINEIFKKYKNKHIGETCIFYGTGPSINNFINNFDAIRVGTNEIIYKPYFMHYYFIGDPGNKGRGYLSDPEAYDNYNPLIAKFTRKKHYKVAGFSKGNYEITDRLYYDGIYYTDISQGMGCLASISMEAMQFILYAGFKRIYLVGHDCTYDHGSFWDKEQSKKIDAGQMIKAWRYMKKFIDDNYPGVSVYSINPVNLDIFPEWKQQYIIENIDGIDYISIYIDGEIKRYRWEK